MNVETTASFDRDFRKLPASIRTRARRTLALLLENPRHPSLHFKKMAGVARWEVRVTLSYRIILDVEGDLYMLRRIGTHDVLREA